ncbi:MAG: L-aspartate oxidase [Firmicutes bacterium]|nr:L-aspartate oxidase [Bacillota bacterium]
MLKTDVVIIGSGIGALSVAGELCRHNKKVTIVTKALRKSSNSSLAQGGISVVLSDEDKCEYHYEDTMIAGCYHNDSDAVMALVTKAPEIIKKFIDTGMDFDKDSNGNLLFGREGAHRLSRIIHAGGDRTGLKVVEQLLRNINENVTVNENEMVLDLRISGSKCNGIITRDKDNNIKYYEADYTVLATGGIGQLYPATSNDTTITGDGLAMAYRAGCRLENLEFIQFHPTMLTINGKTLGLVSEAVRGSGGILVNEKGEHIMEGVHPQKDLAPRDVVAREVYSHYLAGEKIYLDISTVENFREHFPTVTEICESNGVDLGKKLIPVGPGVHFHMGGVKAGVDGTTDIESLYAVGEVACTGVHGANRLASNSLLEGIVFGELTAEKILASDLHSQPMTDTFSDITLGDLPTKAEIQSKMMEFVGIVRHESAIDEIINWFKKYMPANNNFGKIDILHTPNDKLEIYNMLTVGYLIAIAAKNRKESLGAHYIEK